MAWAIYYGDGTIVTSAALSASWTPAENVQVIITKSKSGTYLTVTGRDYYIYRDGRWFAVDWDGLTDYLRQPGWKIVRFGRTLDTQDYQKILDQAIRDLDEYNTA